MSKFSTFLLLGGLALGTIAAVRPSPDKMRAPAEFIQVSVLADNQADYGVDEVLQRIPSISMDIVVDKLQDEGKSPVSLPIILFTTSKEEDKQGDVQTPEQPPQDVKNPETEEVQDPGNNGNGQEKEKEKNNNGNGHNKDKDKEKDKDKDKEKDKDKDKEKDKDKDKGKTH